MTMSNDHHEDLAAITPIMLGESDNIDTKAQEIIDATKWKCITTSDIYVDGVLFATRLEHEKEANS